MLPASADAISADDIVSLVANQTPERKTLEFKEKLADGTDKAKKEFLADVCSFANAEGGYIIYGIRERRAMDGQPTGIAEAVVSLADPNPSVACDRLEQLIRTGIAPRIPVVQVRKIELANQEWVIVLRIGKSWVRPHMVVFAGTSRFFSRNSSGKFQLDVGEIGQAFAEQRTVGERLRNWRAERISKLLSGDGPMPLDGKRNLLFHFVPASCLVGPSVGRDWKISEQQRAFLKPSSLNSSVSARYNSDGYLTYSMKGATGTASYAQVFQSGALEYGDGYILGADEDLGRENSIPSKAFEKKIAEIYESGLRLLATLNVEDPVYFACALVMVRGLRLSRDQMWDVGESHTFDRDVIATPDFQILDRLEGRPYFGSVLPLINSIWQANGYEQSPFAGSAWNPFNY